MPRNVSWQLKGKRLPLLGYKGKGRRENDGTRSPTASKQAVDLYQDIGHSCGAHLSQPPQERRKLRNPFPRFLH